MLLLWSWLSMLSDEIHLRLKPYLVVKIFSDIVTEYCCQVCDLSLMFCRSDCRLCADMVVSDCAISRLGNYLLYPVVWHSDGPTWDMKNIICIWFSQFTLKRYIGARIIPCVVVFQWKRLSVLTAHVGLAIRQPPSPCSTTRDILVNRQQKLSNSSSHSQ